MGRKIKIFFGIIFLLVGFAFLGNAVVTGEPYGATFGAFIVIAGIYLLFSSSEPKIPKMKPSDVREIKGIKVIEKDNKIIAKGIPERTKGILLAGILILILVLFIGSISPNKFNPTVIAIFALVIIVGSIIHAIKQRKKAIRQYDKKEIS